MRTTFQPLVLVLLLLAASCSKQSEPTPALTRSATANNAPAYNPDPNDGSGGGSGGGGNPGCTPAEASPEIKDRIKAYVTKQCRLNGWTIVKTITPPDGITYGLGCGATTYPFSVDTDGGLASGTYNGGTGAFTLSRP